MQQRNNFLWISPLTQNTSLVMCSQTTILTFRIFICSTEANYFIAL